MSSNSLRLIIHFSSLSTFVFFPFLLFAQSPQGSERSIDELAEKALKAWKAPGLALVIVQEDKILHLKGYGLRTIGKNDSVTADTLFPLASCSKSFTSLALAMLADDGKLAWDDPVRKFLPTFHLADPLADAQVTLRDLLTHRTGVGSHELLWYHAPWSWEERLRKVSLLEPQHSFRSAFQYQSILFGAAGYAGANANGSTWLDLIDKRILSPLQMKNSFATFPAKPPADLASPHRRTDKGEIVVMPRYPLEDADPAGSIHSSARDLASYLRFQLGDGAWQGKRLVSQANLGETHMPQIVIRREGFAELMNPKTLQISYGLGWIVQDYRGIQTYMHGGAIDGFRAHLTLVPQANLGIGILSNLDGGFMNLALANSLVDLLLRAPADIDWNAWCLKLYEAEQEGLQKDAAALRAKRKLNTKTSLPLTEYVGEYVDPAYGTCKISLEKDSLVWNWSTWRSPLEHFHFDTFLIHLEKLETPLVFTLGADGRVDGLNVLERRFGRK